MWKWLFLALLAPGILLAQEEPPKALLQWDAVTTNANGEPIESDVVQGYRIHWGMTSRGNATSIDQFAYDNVTDFGPGQLTADIVIPEPGTYYFSATAWRYGREGEVLESIYSNEVSTTFTGQHFPLVVVLAAPTLNPAGVLASPQSVIAQQTLQDTVSGPLLVNGQTANNGVVAGMPGEEVYTDRDDQLAYLPPSYDGAVIVKMTDAEKQAVAPGHIQLPNLPVPATVIVAYNTISDDPSWLEPAGWVRDNTDLIHTNSGSYWAYTQDFPAGPVALNGSGCPDVSFCDHYLVLIKPLMP